MAYEYDALGWMVRRTTATEDTQLTYAGDFPLEERDAEGPNLFAYTGHSPTAFIDPTGLCISPLDALDIAQAVGTVPSRNATTAEKIIAVGAAVIPCVSGAALKLISKLPVKLPTKKPPKILDPPKPIVPDNPGPPRTLNGDGVHDPTAGSGDAGGVVQSGTGRRPIAAHGAWRQGNLFQVPEGATVTFVAQPGFNMTFEAGARYLNMGQFPAYGGTTFGPGHFAPDIALSQLGVNDAIYLTTNANNSSGFGMINGPTASVVDLVQPGGGDYTFICCMAVRP